MILSDALILSVSQHRMLWRHKWGHTEY